MRVPDKNESILSSIPKEFAFYLDFLVAEFRFPFPEEVKRILKFLSLAPLSIGPQWVGWRAAPVIKDAEPIYNTWDIPSTAGSTKILRKKFSESLFDNPTTCPKELRATSSEDDPQLKTKDLQEVSTQSKRKSPEPSVDEPSAKRKHKDFSSKQGLDTATLKIRKDKGPNIIIPKGLPERSLDLVCVSLSHELTQQKTSSVLSFLQLNQELLREKQEVLKLRKQVESLSKRCESQEQELQKYATEAQEAMARAEKQSAELKAAKRVLIKSLSAKLKDMSRRPLPSGKQSIEPSKDAVQKTGIPHPSHIESTHGIDPSPVHGARDLAGSNEYIHTVHAGLHSCWLSLAKFRPSPVWTDLVLFLGLPANLGIMHFRHQSGDFSASSSDFPSVRRPSGINPATSRHQPGDPSASVQ
ncbi:hypothetical protein CJ030_MR3G009355 [Morella rubra]|uniref:Uncharacterized protein n=1 Tax=Morella rubra TaxID=262757 RepID=A0A6A1W6C7_9ROSI|nr:hypothetical protein CJ030_MR3G009355 [Morella rubra]